jgi:hypothetical protein
MKPISIRDIVLVLALVVASTNWVLDHRAQSARQEAWQREFNSAKEGRDQTPQPAGIKTEQT